MPAVFQTPFPKIIPATFLDRPNRFILRCRLPGGETVRAFLPNPGRLRELLLPKAEIYLAPAADRPGRKTKYTAIGIAGSAHPVFLHTHVTNAVARHLLETGQVPGFRRARIVRAEAPLGNSRFDFLLHSGGRDVYLEVKSCTLFGNRVAMFPDAITDRGRRHLEELAALSKEGTKTAVLFVVHSNAVDWFMPDYHTDLAFSQTLLAVRQQVRIIPLAVSWNRDFSLAPGARELAIPWRHVAREAVDRGNYLLVYRSQTPGTPPCPHPYYLATGWCERALQRTVAKLKARPPRGLECVDAFPIASRRNRQNQIDEALKACYAPHLPASEHASEANVRAFHAADPRDEARFHDLLAAFRMAHPAFP